MVKAEEIVFGYASLDNQNVVKLYVDNIYAASQIAFVLGKLLPMGVDLWIGSIPKDIPDTYIPLRIVQPNEPELQRDLPNRTKRWYPAVRNVVLSYHSRFSPNIEDIKVSIPIG